MPNHIGRMTALIQDKGFQVVYMAGHGIILINLNISVWKMITTAINNSMEFFAEEFILMAPTSIITGRAMYKHQAFSLTCFQVIEFVFI